MSYDAEAVAAKRRQDTLDSCKTDEQRARVEQAHADGKIAWTENRMGKTVVSEAKRYFAKRDAASLGEGLYRFSMGALNSIAHYDLGGFRCEYRHPALWIDRLLTPNARLAGDDHRDVHVYKDGMTFSDVLVAILRMAVEQREALVSDFNDKQRAATLAEATRLAESLGMVLVTKAYADRRSTTPS